MPATTAKQDTESHFDSIRKSREEESQMNDRRNIQVETGKAVATQSVSFNGRVDVTLIMRARHSSMS